MLKTVPVHTCPAQKEGIVVNVFHIIKAKTRYQAVYLQKMVKKPMTGPWKTL